MLIASQNKSLINKLKSQLNDEFAAKNILGMEIYKDRKAGKLYLSQNKYLEKVLNRYNMSDCKSVSTPLVAHFKLSFESCPKSEEKIEKISHISYSSTVGSLMYDMVCTRPHLSYVVSVVSRFIYDPGKNHGDAVKWILPYVKGSLDKGLVFDRSESTTFDIVFMLALTML